MSVMGVSGVLLGFVFAVQGVAWLGGPGVGMRRRGQGGVLAPLSMAVVLLSLLHVLVPGFVGEP